MTPAAMHVAYLSLGSNQGDREALLREAITRLAALPETRLLALSHIRETAPWGKTDQPAFFNMAVTIETRLTPESLLEATQEIEASMGRQRTEYWGPRTIDIDLLAYEGETRQTDRLTLPHPYLTQRRFVLEPLADIAPSLCIHGKTVQEWLDLIG